MPTTTVTGSSVTMNVFVIIIMLGTLVYVHALSNRMRLKPMIDRAVQDSEYNPTEFYIYDKSTERVCNRLIQIKPFDWYVWATGKDLYILNQEGGISCGPASTPVIRVLKDHFIETCLKIDYDSILRGYTGEESNATLKVVPYTIESRTFTILSALNILVKDWIYFDTNVTSNPGHKIKALSNEDVEEVVTKRKKRVAEEGRELTGEQVSRIVTTTTTTTLNGGGTRSGKSYTELLRQYRLHFAKNYRRNDTSVPYIRTTTTTARTTQTV
jgi:hypothetical protein